jgi:hypothetical protein
MIIELIGYLAAVVTFTGFLSSNVKIIRIFSLAAGVIWIGYGVLIGSGSIILCNVVIAALQLIKLITASIDKKRIRLEELVLIQLKLEAEMRNQETPCNLEWQWDQINKEQKKLRKSFFM